MTEVGVEEVGDLVAGVGDLETAAAATICGLDGDRQAVLVREGDDLVGAADRLLGPGDEWCSGALGDVTCLDLVAECVDRGGRRSDPRQARVENRLRE